MSYFLTQCEWPVLEQFNTKSGYEKVDVALMPDSAFLLELPYTEN